MDLLNHRPVTEAKGTHLRLEILAFAVLMMLPISTALRGYFLPITALHLDGHRIFLIIGVVIAVIGRSTYLYTGRLTRLFSVLAFLWITWGLISCFWVPQLSPAFSELFSVGLGLLLGFLVFNLGRITPHGVEAVSTG